MVETVECDNPYWSQTETFFLSRKGIQTGQKGCGCAIWKKLDVASVITSKVARIQIGKKTALEKRNAEEAKLILVIYDEAASTASSQPSTSGILPLLKRVDSTIYSHDIQDNKRHILAFAMVIGLLVAMRTWDTDGTFKVVPQWCQQLFTIHAFVAALINKAAVLMANINRQTIICDFETALIPAIQGYFLNTRVQCCYFYVCKAVHKKVGELGVKTRYRTEE
ncbi:hypothetical protein T4B_12760 [Trichinella pseudospiralis]|uniref:MULE transposase domain-containing protein n=1 Tax=Trichinella pseudospiralis TaxID=6337 RepID=A0A0V1JIX5_TRIPS|nr:hypothetical protein T4B_12760 [Trichinella pseudospiralis]KRZ34895.1 hypothetical protein T4C_2216 [Trichinella pseudospiralis]